MFKAALFCFIILFSIAVNFFLSNKTKSEMSRNYSFLLIVSLIHLCFDMASLYTVNHLDTVLPIINDIVHRVFIVTMLMAFYITYRYLVIMVESEIETRISERKNKELPFLISIVLALILPIGYIETPKGNYATGLAASVVYFSVGIYTVLIFILLIKYHKKIPEKKMKAIVIAMLCESLLSIFQLFNPTALVSNLGVLLINIGFYITVENPDAVLVELLKKATAKADAANKAKTAFLANMSHEIRTPINAILGMNEMILRESREQETISYASEVKSAAQSLLGIINDILDISKIEAGKLDIIPVEYHLSSLINDINIMMSLKAVAKGLEFNIISDDDLPSVIIGDDLRLKQIILNLTNNAIKYTNSGTVTLEIRKRENDALYFCVTDTGIGIKPEDIEKLKTPFERLEEKRNRHIEGTGLGLSITMRLLSLMQSELNVESVYGEGSKFYFTITQKVVDATPIDVKAICANDSSNREQYSSSFEAPDAKVLVVDDNKVNLKVFKMLLRETKIQVTEAMSGRECLDLVAKERFDIIFLDHMMSEMDGLQTFEAMRKMENNLCANSPVIILTANAIAGAKEFYLDFGFDGFVSKPIDPPKLEKSIYERLDKKLIRAVSAPRTAVQSDDFGELDIIEGVDWRYAKLNFNDRQSLCETIAMFYSSIDSEAKKLQSCFDEVISEQQFDSYRIQVHSMKNSAAMIGIVCLSGMAMTLESAARNQNAEIIAALHPIFIKKWQSYIELLAQFVPKSEGKKQADEHIDEIEALFEKLRVAADDMDVDMLDDIAQQLDEYSFEAEKAEMINDIKLAILNFEVEKLTSCHYL